MRKHVTLLAGALGLAGCFALNLSAQQYPLPLDMVAKFGANASWAEEFQLTLNTQSQDDFVIGRVSYQNEDAGPKRVTIAWQFKASGAIEGNSTQSVDVSFKPTAVARRAGTTTVIYVVGWSDRTGRVVVERWDLSQAVLGDAIPVGGGAAYSLFSQPHIERSIEWISETGSVSPIWDAACEVYGNSLLLLTRAPTKILSLNLDSRTTTNLYSASDVGLSGLAGHRMISIGKHSTGGFIAFTEPRKPWESVMQYLQLHDYFVMRDSDSDGSFDSTAFVDYSLFYDIYPPPWNMKYHEP